MLKTKKQRSGRYTSARSAARREDVSPGTGILSVLRASFFGSLIACAVGAVLLFLGTAIAYAQPDPEPFARPIGYAVALLTALTAGAISSRRNGRAVLLCGLLSAAFLLLVFSVLSILPVFSDAQPMPIGLSFALHGAVLPFAVGGSYLGRKRGRR